MRRERDKVSPAQVKKATEVIAKTSTRFAAMSPAILLENITGGVLDLKAALERERGRRTWRRPRRAC